MPPEKTVTPKAAASKADLSEGFFRVWVPTLVVALFIITFVVQPFDIPSASMENTLLIGDHLLADRVRFSPEAKWASWLLPYRGPDRGDVVVFLATPSDSVTAPGTYIVKRLIGIPGDHIHLKGGVVYRNGQALTEPYTITTGPYDPSRDEWPAGQLWGETPEWQAVESRYLQGGDIVVPPGQYFMMGDNRDDSEDSRYWGFVPRANVIGRPSVVYWSYKSDGSDYTTEGLGERIGDLFTVLIHAPVRTRWARTLHLVK